MCHVSCVTTVTGHSPPQIIHVHYLAALQIAAGEPWRDKWPVSHVVTCYCFRYFRWYAITMTGVTHHRTPGWMSWRRWGHVVSPRASPHQSTPYTQQSSHNCQFISSLNYLESCRRIADNKTKYHSKTSGTWSKIVLDQFLEIKTSCVYFLVLCWKVLAGVRRWRGIIAS